ncbi:unnamed protein product [Heligmosomoides polygyrus]|uniref:DUF3778 domain-containing protein n=1 Tax=Heligmosomoides polygyrus TaxID=6339 RepID=A0A183GJF6_HELPZ|nr:unnamed protein product [Heligmosomoides polygyrus]
MGFPCEFNQTKPRKGWLSAKSPRKEDRRTWFSLSFCLMRAAALAMCQYGSAGSQSRRRLSSSVDTQAAFEAWQRVTIGWVRVHVKMGICMQTFALEYIIICKPLAVHTRARVQQKKEAPTFACTPN